MADRATPNDLQHLFSQLKTQQRAEPQMASNQPPNHSESIWMHPHQQQAHQQPSVSSPLFSPPAQTPNPIHSSNIISPANPSSAIGTPAPEQDRTNNLLNLLKFNHQGGQAQGQQPGPMANLQNIGGSGRSGSMHSQRSQVPQGQSQAFNASYQQRQPSAPGVLPSPLATADVEHPDTGAAPPRNTQDFLLNLLGKPNEQKAAAAAKAASQQGNAPSETTRLDDASIDNLAQGLAEASVNSPRQAQPQKEEQEKPQYAAPQPTKAKVFSSYVNPFDQLHASSPLNQTPQPEAQNERRKIEILKHDRESSNTQNGELAPASKSRKIAADRRSPVVSPELTSAEKAQSVSQALEDIGDQVDKQAEEALAKAGVQDEDSHPTGARGGGENTPNKPFKLAEPKSAASKPKNDEVDSSWESAEDEQAVRNEKDKVEVYNFPLKPFTSVHIKGIDNARAINQDNFMVIAQLKKSFDQVDRCLITASQTHIVYATAANKKDNGGFRIIRQDSGDHKQVFRSSGERVFSVQLCTSGTPGDDVESVLGTGVNGSIFWTTLAKSRGDLFADDDVEAQGFIMPPVATAEEQASGSPVKTRAKLSTRHPEFMAVSRGKQIFIVAPEKAKDPAYCNSNTRRIDSEKFLAQHSLKIMTGKAGKDFCFSADDSVVASLDKSGRFKFWDIKDIACRAADLNEGAHEPVELREPVWHLSASTSGSRADEKPSVSSIMFLDKEKPSTKGMALRYVLIGFKQNHILQLWDLGLGKAVQEIRLPHEKDSDGICSITYHPRNSIIAIGHPTRNSVYFIHLSAPRYNVPHMSQAKFMKLLATSDPFLPRVESTAIMSGLREFSFGKAGQLRSLDMLVHPVENASDPNSEDATLFELYVMHAKGVIGMGVKRRDLGWDKDNKMVKPVDAVAASAIEVKDLIPAQFPPPASEQSSNADAPAKAGEPSKKSKKADKSKDERVKKEQTSSSGSQAGPSRATEAQTPASKQVPEARQQQTTNPPLMTAESYSNIAQRPGSPAREKPAREAHNASENMTPQAAAASVSADTTPHMPVNVDVEGVLKTQFDSLYERMASDKRVHDAAENSRQDAILRLVSSTLTENVEQSLHRIINSGIEREVIPRVSEHSAKAIEKKLSDLLQQSKSDVSHEVKTVMPSAIQQALKDQSVLRSISNEVSTKLQQQMSNLLQQSIPKVAMEASQKMVSDMEKRTNMELREAENRRQKDNAKIEELSKMVRGLTETVKTMSESQAAFQEQVLSAQQSAATQQGHSRNNTIVSGPTEESEPEDPEVQKITRLLMDGHYDAATLEWLQSARQAELFDLIFVRVNPLYLEKVSPLIALSVSAAITTSFDHNLVPRLHWLENILDTLNLRDDEIRDVAPKIMDVLSARLQGVFFEVSEARPADEVLVRLRTLVRRVADVRRMVG